MALQAEVGTELGTVHKQEEKVSSEHTGKCQVRSTTLSNKYAVAGFSNTSNTETHWRPGIAKEVLRGLPAQRGRNGREPG